MFHRSKKLKVLLGAALLASTAGTALAQTPTRIGQFNDWSAISYQGANGKVCYAVSVPTASLPDNVNHGDNFFVVTQRRGQNVSYEPQFIAGYTLQEASKVTVTIDGRAFTFFSKANTAWTENAAEDPTIVAAMRAGAKMNVQATSRRGTNTSYDYSLSGVTAALNAIQSCQ